MRRLFSTCALVLLLFAPAAHAAPTPFSPGTSVRFGHLTIEDGLSQNAGLALLQDRTGFLWIGTQDGLNRYDGYALTHFKHDPADPASISHNSVIALYEDPTGFLWVGTWGGGLNRFDPQSGTFTRYLPDPDDPASLSHPIVTAITQDRAGRLWVGTLGGLDLLDPATGRFTHVRSDPANPASLSSNAISAILPDPDGALWVGTGAFSTPGAGLNRFEPDTGGVQRLPPSGDCLHAASISSLVRDPQGGLWIGYGGYGVPGGGIDWFDPQSGACRHWNGSAPRGEGQNVTRLLLDRAGALWGAVWGDGVWRMALDTPGAFTSFRHDPSDPASLSNNSIFSLLQDRTGMLWIGTLNSGVNTLNLDTLAFRHYRHNPANPDSLPSNRVGAFAESPDGTLWVATWESGIARFDPQRGAFQHYRHDPADPNSLSGDLVMALYADADNTLWAGTLGSGLNHFDPRSGHFTHYRHDPGEPTSLIDDQVTTMLRDAQGRLWVATFGGLARMDPGAQGFVNYALAAPPVSLMLRGAELWIGTWGAGVLQLDLAQPASLDPASAVFTSMVHNPDDPNSLSENSVWTMHSTTDGIIWLGTQGGLNRYDPAGGTFTHYTEKNGLRNATILGILEDRTGFLWITTNNGLARFDPRSAQFRIYDRSDGLQGNEFNSNAYMLSPRTGAIYVGGGEGFSVFDPDTLAGTAVPPTVVITGFKLFNESFPYDAATPVTLDYDEDYISFEFAALDFRSPARNSYAYKLEGFDQDWVQAGSRRYASYTNLPGGSYTFRVRAASSSGAWSTTDATLRLVVIPPFWQRWPFQLTLAAGLLALMVAGFQWRVRAYKAESRRLEAVVAQRTAELRESNEQLASEVEQRKRAEDELARRTAGELRASEARFRAVFENAAVGVAVMTLDRRIIQVNPTAERITGYDTAALAMLDPSTLVVLEDRALDRELFQELVAGQRDQYLVEKRYIRKDGTIFWGRINFALVRGAAGEPLYTIGIIEDITEEKRAAERLAAQEGEYRRMLEQRIAARTEELNRANELLREKTARDAVSAERSRLARDLHDAVSQTLFSAALIADVLPELWELNPEDARRRLVELRQLTRGALAEMRTLLVELRPNALVDVPLPLLLRQFTEALNGRARIHIQLNVEGERKLPADVQVGLYRIAQEALNNVVKHARATEAFVTLRLGPHVRLTVADNGVGFDPSTVTADHLGIKIMRERADAIDAVLSVYSEPGEGTQISVVWREASQSA